VSTEDFKAQADRVAAELVTEHLGGSISAEVYTQAVEVVAIAYMRGGIARGDEVLASWNEQLTKAEAAL